MSKAQAVCQHEMKCIGDLIYECQLCGQTEIGCSHSRTKGVKIETKDGNNFAIVCRICGLMISTIPVSDSTPNPEDCQHNFEAVNRDDMSCSKITCGKCGYTTNCQHGVGVYIDNPSGLSFCCRCGYFAGLAH